MRHWRPRETPYIPNLNPLPLQEQKKRMAQKMKESPEGTDAPDSGKQPGSPKSRLAMLKRSSAKKSNASQDPFRFQGEGVQFKGKLIGVRPVDAPRGDSMCAEAMRQAKAAVKAQGGHKKRIVLHINIDGIKIRDEKSAEVLHNFPVSRISFIARDTTDARAFGFVYGETSGQYVFYGIKTAQTADHAVLSIRDMFQIVFEMKKKQIEQVKQKAEEDKKEEEGVRTEEGVMVADLLDLETEVQHIEQGLNQMAHIPVVPGDEWPGEPTSHGAFADPFGAQPFGIHTPPQSYSHRADPFGDSFGNSTASSFNSFSTPQTTQSVPSPFGTPLSAYTSPANAAPPAFYQQPQQLQKNGWAHQQPVSAFPQTHSTPSFSTTNPFADLTSAVPAVPSSGPVMSDPFDTAAIRQNLATPQTLTSQQNGAINWGTNENAAPNGLTHAHSFTANFENGSAIRKTSSDWDAPRKVTSLEDAFTKLVDMDTLIGKPAETKKNPFEHIINPPKIPLNSLSTAPAIPQRSAAPVFPASANDPFSDAFFN